MKGNSELDLKIKEMAGRIRELREIEGFTPEFMAGKTGVSKEEYLNLGANFEETEKQSVKANTENKIFLFIFHTPIRN